VASDDLTEAADRTHTALVTMRGLQGLTKPAPASTKVTSFHPQ
jgi:hypothetical protein